MAEEATTTQETTATGGDSKKTYTADEVKALRSEIETSFRSKYADYGDLKAKAAELDKQTEANKSELQKTQDALVAAQAETAKALAQARAMTIAAEHKLSVEDAALVAAQPDEQTQKALAARLATAATKTGGNRVPSEGRTSTAPPENEMAEFTAQLFGRD